MELKELEITNALRGTRIVLRASLNVPIIVGKVENPFRIIQALPTIEALAAHGARVVVVAHIGDGPADSLKPVWEEMKRRSKVAITFVDDTVHQVAASAVKALKDGEVLLLENIRRERGEKSNDPALAEALAAFGDLYVNDAFSDSHRAHASIVGVPKLLPSVAGPAFMNEYRGIVPALTPPSPSLAIVGGAKFMTKEPLIRALFAKYDRVFVGGALANDFLKAKGYEVGKSLVSDPERAKTFLTDMKLVLPEDVVVQGVDGARTKSVADVTPFDTILDVGPRSIEKLSPLIDKARLILWNGPLGNFEKGFSMGTETLARSVAEAQGQSIVGGGDTIAAIQNLKLTKHFTFVSTAGGAMLEFIASGTLVGIEALKSSKQI